jgi:hypothetical protein
MQVPPFLIINGTYAFIGTYITSKYKDAKVKVTSLTSAKEKGTLELI